MAHRYFAFTDSSESAADLEDRFASAVVLRVHDTRWSGTTPAEKAIAALKTVPRLGIAAHLAQPVVLDFRGVKATSPFVLNYNLKAGDGSAGSGISDYNTTPILCLWGGHQIRQGEVQSLTSNWVNLFEGGAMTLMDANGVRLTGRHNWQTVDKTVLCTGTAASDTLTVNAGQTFQGDGLLVGSAVSVFGLAPRDGGDKATVSGANVAGAASILVGSTSQLPSSGTVLAPGGFLITYTGKDATHLTGCTWGTFGTTAASFAGGEVLTRAVYDVFEVLAVSGTGVGRTVQLDRAVGLTGTALKAVYGATRVAFLGAGTIDTNKDPAVDDVTNPHGLLARFASHLYTAPGMVFQNGDHGGIGLTQALHCDVNGLMIDNGRPASSLGAGVWFFGGVRNCTGRVRIKRGYAGVFIDSRSSGGADTDQMCDANHVIVPSCDGAARPIVIADGSSNVVEAGTVTNYTSQLATIEALQWGTTALPKRNRITIRSADLSGASEGVTTNAANGGNVIECDTYGARAGSVEVGNTAKVFAGLVSTQGITGVGSQAAVNRAIGDVFPVRFDVAAGAAGTILNPTNCPPGARFILRVTNNTAGAITPTFGALYKLPAITWPTAGKAIDLLMHYDGTRVALAGAPTAEYTP